VFSIQLSSPFHRGWLKKMGLSFQGKIVGGTGSNLQKAILWLGIIKKGPDVFYKSYGGFIRDSRGKKKTLHVSEVGEDGVSSNQRGQIVFVVPWGNLKPTSG